MPRWIWLAGVACGLAGGLAAQDARGRILGRVLDRSSALVTGAEVVATQVEMNTRVSARSNDAGNYDLPFLLPGIGRQGGDVEAAVQASFTGDPASCLVAVAAAVMYADDPRRAAVVWRDRIRRITDAVTVPVLMDMARRSRSNQ